MEVEKQKNGEDLVCFITSVTSGGPEGRGVGPNYK